MARKLVVQGKDRVEIPVRVEMPLGYLCIQPVSGRSWDEELVDALKTLGATREEGLVVTFSRARLE